MRTVFTEHMAHVLTQTTAEVTQKWMFIESISAHLNGTINGSYYLVKKQKFQDK